jgi:tetratricopeptide (TPR) repeat protein
MGGVTNGGRRLRDEFTRRTSLRLAQRVGFRCSNPHCQRATVGASPTTQAVLSIGVAAHLTAAAEGGPRFDATLSRDGRRAPSNGIWLCQSCARLIDSDPAQFPVDLLQRWKAVAEGRAYEDLLRGRSPAAVVYPICSAPLESLSPFFVERPQLTEQLAAQFVGGAFSQVLVGAAGVGKTQQLLRYAQTRQADYRQILWVVADNETSLLEGWRRNARLLGLPYEAGVGTDDLEFYLFNWLRTTRDWLVLVDNYEPAAVASLARWLVLPPTGHTLISSRERITTRSLFGRSLVVEPFSEGEGVSFLAHRTGRGLHDEVELAAAREINARLEGLPLALEQAGAHIVARGDDFSAALRQVPLAGSGAIGQPALATWSSSLAAARAEHDATQHLLAAVAHLAAEGAPPFVLAAFVAESFAISPEVAADVVRQGLRPALRYSLVSESAAGYRMHRLLRQFLMSETAAHERSVVLSHLAGALTKLHPEEPERRETWEQSRMLLPHAVALAEAWEDERGTSTSATLFERAGRYAAEAAMHETAEKLLKLALGHAEAAQGALSTQAISLSARLGSLYRAQGRTAESLKAYQRALDGRISKHGPLHSDVALTHNNIGNTLYDAGDISGAEAAYRDALAVWDQLNEDHEADAALTMNGLANVLRRLGQRDEAERLFRKAIRIWSASEHTSARWLGFALNGLGNLLFDRGEYEAALTEYGLADAAWKRLYGPSHPTRAYALNNIGRAYEALGVVDAASAAFEEALALRRELLSERHPLVLAVAANLERVQSACRQ